MALKIGKIKHKPGIRLTGPLYQTTPFARFNRELSSRLIQNGHHDLCLAAEDLNSSHALSLPAELEAKISRKPSHLQFELIHQGLPPELETTSAKWIHCLPWEYGSSPIDWHQLLLYSSDEVWVHTRENYELYQKEGIHPDRLALVPIGVDAKLFNPSAPPMRIPGRKKFCFLFSGELLWYSGLDLLLQAFVNEFLPDEEVSLIIKVQGATHSTEQKGILQMIQNFQANPDNPSIVLLEHQMNAQEEASLYTACQALVSPFRAEAFGFSIFEAMACGLPVILTQTEHRLGIEESDLNIWLKSRPVKSTEKQIGGIPTLHYPSWHENNLAEIRYHMRHLFENPSKFQAMGSKASQYVHQNFSWEQTLEIALNRIKNLNEKPIFRQEQNRLQAKTLQALEKLHAGYAQEALELLEEVLLEDSGNPVLHLDIGTLQLQLKHYSEALNHFQTALKQSPNNANLYSVAGIALYHSGALSLAQKSFQQALQLNPEHQGARESLKAFSQSLEPSEIPAEFAEWEKLLESAPQAKHKQSLSLCMIVKNEERFLRNCLESVREIVDEMIIVDTGSTDQTVKIAEEMGAQVFHFKWTGSFSEARNQAIQHASGDWILILDADEVIAPETLHNIHELIKTPQSQLTGYQLKIRNFSKEGNEIDTVEHYMLRLFPRHSELHYTGFIHEQLEPRTPGYPFERLATPDVLILHYGYTGSLMQERDKYQRNLELVQTSLRQDPENPFHSFNLGLTYRVQEENEAALAAFLDAVEKSKKRENLPTYMSACWSYIASIYLQLNQNEKALDTLQNAPEICQSNPDYWVNFGTAWSQAGEYTKSIEAFQKAMALRLEAFTSLVSDRAATTWKPYAGIGNTYLMQGDLENADHYFRRALRENPENPEIRLGLARLALFRQKPDEARKYLDDSHLPPQQAGAFQLELARCEMLEKNTPAALTLLEKLVENFDATDALGQAARVELGNLYLRENQIDKARALLENLEPTHALLQNIARFHFKTGALEKVKAIYNNLIAKDLAGASDFRHRGIIWLEEGRHREAQADFEKALSLDAKDPDSLHNLGVIALQQGDYALAKNYFLTVRAKFPDFVLSSLDLASIELNEGHNEQAEAYLREILLKEPHHADTLMLLAGLKSSQGETGEASALYMDILEKNPRHSEALIQLGYLLIGIQEYSQALQLFERALNIGPQTIALYNGIGLIFLEQEKFIDARNAFLLAYQLEPDNEEVLKALQISDRLCEQTQPA